MIEPNPLKHRQNINIALEEEKSPISEIKLEPLELQFMAHSLNEKLSQTIIISNISADQNLQGKWSVSPHINDPPHTPNHHSWISFLSQEIEKNKVSYAIEVDTSKLKADQNYERKIVFKSNNQQENENYHVTIKVKTAPINQIKVTFPPYLLIGISIVVIAVISSHFAPLLILGISIDFIFTILIEFILGIFGAIFGGFSQGIFGVIFGGIFGVIFGRLIGGFSQGKFGLIFGSIFGGIMGRIFGRIFGRFIAKFMGRFLGKFIGKFIGRFLGKFMDKKGLNTFLLNRKITALYIFFTFTTGILIGVCAKIDFNYYLFIGLSISALALNLMLIYPLFKLQRLKAQYRHQESQNLIES